jgi:hypothetical protein
LWEATSRASLEEEEKIHQEASVYGHTRRLRRLMKTSNKSAAVCAAKLPEQFGQLREKYFDYSPDHMTSSKKNFD